MRHAKTGELDGHGDLLTALRGIDGLKEKSYGTFYRKSRGFLHFHIDGDDLWADIKPADEWQRLPATTASDRAALIKLVQTSL
ncbi:MAG: hypothetical protein QOG03_1926 [Actinomycetota bacterium]|jgi:hypothetical protein|nr:hypothetical protein [Actinomycetota bacterium]